jgi:uncharacterized protein (DUF2147 family)
MKMFRLILGATLFVVSSLALAGGVEGKWRTESNKAGGFLEVTVGPCDSDAKKTCGVITQAFTKSGPDSGYENLGKLIVMDMESSDGISFSGGTIWDPEHDKTYKSKMTLKNDDLDVKGCISFVCSGEDWKRVK